MIDVIFQGDEYYVFIDENAYVLETVIVQISE